MNGDYETQESTEELTTKIISESKEIMSLLNRDGIKLEEIADYHMYPIADNDTPQLAADRLEYTFSNGLGAGDEKLWRLEEIKESDTPIEGKYCVSIKAKIRYIVPLVRVQNEFVRINKISELARQDIEKVLNFKTKKYAYLDFEF